MNVPEFVRATETAMRTFDKRVAEAREELDSELSRCRSQFLEEQDITEEAARARRRSID